MGIDERSKMFADCIKGLYVKEKYPIEYAILQLEKYKDAGKIIASDYEEYLAYFVEEMNKQNEVIEETENIVEEATEEVTDTIPEEIVEGE